MIYALIALGYSMVYGVLKIINFAHGEIFTIGGLLGATFLLSTGMSGTQPILFRLLLVLLAFLFSLSVTAGVGWALERIAYRPLRRASRIAPLLSAIGASIFFQNLLMLIYGTGPIEIPVSAIISGYVTIYGANIRYLAMVIIAVSLFLMLLLTIFIKRSRLGKAMRATSQDREAAEMMGIDTNLTISLTFIIGSALAAVAGIFVAMYYGTIKFDTGFLYGIKAFTAAVFGGIGNVPGAVLGALILGLAENYGVGLNFATLSYVAILGLVLGLIYQYGILPTRPVVVQLFEAKHELTAEEQALRQKRIRGCYYGGWVTGLRAYLTEKQDAAVRLHSLRAIRIGSLNTVLLIFIVVGLTFLRDFQISSQWKDATAFLVLMTVLLFKPSGLLGERLPEKV
jgi:branched-chain amino acid transport system permease protein